MLEFWPTSGALSFEKTLSPKIIWKEYTQFLPVSTDFCLRMVQLLSLNGTAPYDCWLSYASSDYSEKECHNNIQSLLTIIKINTVQSSQQ